MTRRVRAAVAAVLFAVPLFAAAGCGGTPDPTPPSPEDLKEGQKQLNQDRQKEWGGKKN